MSAVAVYLIKSMLLSGVLYGYYQLLLKNKQFHTFNRFYLLSVVAISALIPLMNWEWQHAALPNNIVTVWVEKAGSGAATLTSSFLTADRAVFLAYAIISLSFLAILAFRISWIYRIKKTSRCTRSAGFHFIETDVKGAPFSFLDNLFWKQGLSLTDVNGEKVFRHELTHIRQQHTLDRLFVQILSGLFWINPFYWLVQQELVIVHEFLADKGAISDGDTEAFASMLLYTHNAGHYLSPTHHFFHSPIKRRLAMISSSKTTRHAWLRKAMVVPVALAVIFALALHSQAQTAPFTASAAVPVTSDTIPVKSQEITVVGYSLKKKAKPTTPPASQESLKPVTVTGKKLDKKGTAKEVKKAF